MYEAIMMAATGLQNQQYRLDTIADNISNVNTNGFKSSRLDFKDALYTAWLGPARTPEGSQLKGHGVMTASITKDFKDGALLTTEGMLDFAIEGDGFFAIMRPDGETAYTRGGSFYFSTEADGLYLVNGAGHYILNDQGERIQAPEGTTSAALDQEGNITFTAGDTEERNRLGLYTFINSMGLSSAGGGYYEETEASGAPMESGAKVLQGVLEGSNVELGMEMTRMIRAQRAFSLASRALTTADQMEGIANNLRK